MLVTIESINKRLYKNSYKSPVENPNYSSIGLYSESNGSFFENNAMNKIKNWESLNEDTNIAFNMAIDVLDEMICNCSESSIYNACDILVENVDKVRDASKLANSIKYRMGRKKSNDFKDVNAAKEKSKDAVNSAINTLNNKLNKMRSKDQQKIQKECYTKLYNQAYKIQECDRVVKNYNSVCRRFNMNKTFMDYCSHKNLYQTVYEIAAYIDTYQSSFIGKYNTALESAWYIFSKHYIDFSKSAIIEAVTDYFVLNNLIDYSNAKDIKSLIESSPIFDKEDFECISWFFDENTKLDSKLIDNNGFDDIIDDIS